MAASQEEHVEILVHVSAPSRGQDDAWYRALASEYLAFQQYKRIDYSSESDNDLGQSSACQVQDNGEKQGALHASSSQAQESYDGEYVLPDEFHSSSNADALSRTPVRRIYRTRSATAKNAYMDSPQLSFGSVLDNSDAAVFRYAKKILQTAQPAESQSAQSPTQEASWQQSLRYIPDSQPSHNRAIPELSSPTRVMELYLQHLDTIQILNTPNNMTEHRVEDAASELNPGTSMASTSGLPGHYTKGTSSTERNLGTSPALMAFDKQITPCPTGIRMHTRSRSNPLNLVDQECQRDEQLKSASQPLQSMTIMTPSKRPRSPGLLAARKRMRLDAALSSSQLEFAISILGESREPGAAQTNTSPKGSTSHISMTPNHRSLAIISPTSVSMVKDTPIPDATTSRPPSTSTNFEKPLRKRISPDEIQSPFPLTSSTDIPLETLADIMTPHLQHLADELNIESRYRPVSVTRDIRVLERGYWRFEVGDWDEETRRLTWQFLRLYVEKGKAGWAVSCYKIPVPPIHRWGDESTGDVGLEPGAVSDNHDAREGGIMKKADNEEWRVYCWGGLVGHIFLLIYLASKRKMKGRKAQWIDGASQVVVQM